MLKNFTHKLMALLSRYVVQQEEVLGVDITPGHVRVAQMEQTGDGWQLNKLTTKQIEGQALDSIPSDARDLYVERLRAAVQAAKISTSNVALSIPVSNAIVQVVNLPLMTDEELNAAVATDSLWE